MVAVIRKGAPLLIPLVLCLSLISCDSGGSGGGPDWAGKWEITSVPEDQDRQEVEEGLWVELTTEEVNFFDREPNRSPPCAVAPASVVSYEENRITYQSGGERDTMDVSVSNNILSVTITGDTYTAESTDEIPLNSQDCEQVDLD